MNHELQIDRAFAFMDDNASPYTPAFLAKRGLKVTERGEFIAMVLFALVLILFFWALLWITA